MEAQALDAEGWIDVPLRVGSLISSKSTNSSEPFHILMGKIRPAPGGTQNL